VDHPSLIFDCTRSALKKGNKIGASGDLCGGPDWGRFSTSDVKSLTITPAFLSVRRSCTDLTMTSGIPLSLNIPSRNPMATLLHVPITLNNTKDRLLLLLQALDYSIQATAFVCIISLQLYSLNL
jgi:hypothetical protein